MRASILFIAIFFWTLISRFYIIGLVPPMLSDGVLVGRLVTASVSCLSVIALFFYTKRLTGNNNIALYASFLYAVNPWAIEQNRIISQASNAAGVLVIMLLVALYIRHRAFRLLWMVFIAGTVGFVYPSMWFLHKSATHLSMITLHNILYLLSPEFVFFRNITFWWGGVREWGIVYLTCLPIVICGLYALVRYKLVSQLGMVLVCICIAALNPQFPEGREFYLAMPFFCVIAALGMHIIRTSIPKNILITLSLVFVCMLGYEMSQFLHYYTVHYPLQVQSGREHIHEPF